MTLKAIQCEDCGGSVAFPEDKTLPECPFCGSTKQIPKPLDRQIKPPSFWLPFETTQQDADDAFRAFAKSSFWYPKDIRNASLELQTLLLPAWVWNGHIETHYNGQVRAHSPSGYRPVSGLDSMNLHQVWVPASKALTLAEINQLAPFPTEGSQPLKETPIIPFEVGELTERIALYEAKRVMEATHRNQILSTEGLRELHTSSIFQDMRGEPSLIPVYIGVYRRKDTFYRVLVNGTTGKLIGEAPLDWVKISLIVIAMIGFIFIVINL